MSKNHNKRITKTQLREIRMLLQDSPEMDILETINQVKFITANQLQRLFFTSNENQASNLRTCNRTLNKLKTKYGLVDNLEQRIGGVRAGSGSTVWTISGAGYQLLKLDDITLTATRKRMFEPNILFLEHALAIAETYTRLKEMSYQGKLSDLQVTFEPNNWRTFMKNKVPTFLKPDLFARFALNDETEDFVFYELDQATQCPKRCIRKCLTYLTYYKSGIEQRVNGVLPWVVWITPNKKRRDQLTHHINENVPNAEMIFRVITMEELETLTVGDKNKEADDKQ